MKIVLATHNQGKIREFRKIFSDMGVEAVPISEIADIPEPEETGHTFEENALQKARYYAGKIHMPVLSDDSGIIAHALGDRPGIYSARFAGQHGDDEANNRKLIEERLDGVEDKDRTARFVCAMAAVFPDGRHFTTRGTMEGIIAHEIKGANGFGYDPLFYIPSLGKTMAELTMEEKNKISHRGKALRALVSKLASLRFD